MRTSQTNSESLLSALLTLIKRHLRITTSSATGYCDISFIDSSVYCQTNHNVGRGEAYSRPYCVGTKSD